MGSTKQGDDNLKLAEEVKGIGGTRFQSAEQILSLVENAPINIMCASMDGRIEYLNPLSVETLRTLEDHLPVKVSEIEGGSYDVFHKNPSHQKKLLANEKNLPHRAIIDVAGEKLDLLVSPMRDEQGKYTGPMVTWSIVTEQLKSADEMARVNSMIQNAPINIMCAGLDGEIQFLNPKSVETLKSIESVLPVKVDKILGNTYDVFHKNPAAQRKLLANEANLPHSAKIKVGPETLDLLVTAMKDAKGNFIGPMVTWDIVTARMALIKTLDETSSQLSAAAEELSATATQMAKNAGSTSEQSTSASAAAEEVSAGVQTVATNTEEMSASIKEIARSSGEAASLSKESMQSANATNVVISQLGESSKEIGNIIKVISSIAQQTNLLALNATIEAARAGDAGKGFAVVANEVKELAKQTASATEDITKKIGSIQADSENAVTSIAGITKIVEKLNDISGSIAASVEEQTATTAEVTRVVQESSKGVDDIANIVRVVAASADQSATGANETLEASKILSKLAIELKELVKKVEI